MPAQYITIRQRAIENLRQSVARSEQALGNALLHALVESGLDLRTGPSLDEVKCLLVDVGRAVRRSANEGAQTAA